MSPLSNLFKRGSKPKAGQLYGAAVAQARQPVFYAQMGVDDTPDGRFAMISLHILLIFERLSAPKAPAGQPETANLESDRAAADGKAATGHQKLADRDPELGRALMEVFVADLDQSMRELGIGDMGVPKRAKKAMAQFYDYARRYRALAQSESESESEDGAEAVALHMLLSDMIPGLSIKSASLTPLAAYVRTVETTLARETFETLRAGVVTFPGIDVTAMAASGAPGSGAV